MNTNNTSPATRLLKILQDLDELRQNHLDNRERKDFRAGCPFCEYGCSFIYEELGNRKVHAFWGELWKYLRIQGLDTELIQKNIQEMVKSGNGCCHGHMPDDILGLIIEQLDKQPAQT